MTGNASILAQKRAALMADWKAQVASKADIVFPDDGKSYPTTDYFCTDGPVEGFDNAKNRLVVLGREARYNSKQDYPTHFIKTWDKNPQGLNTIAFFRRVLKIAYCLEHNLASISKTAAEIYTEFRGNNQFPVSFIEVSKYSNDADNGAVSDYNLQNRFLEDSELDKRNYFMEELELHNLHEGDMIISNNLFNGGIKSKYLSLMFDNTLIKIGSNKDGKADYYTLEVSGKKILFVDLYHLSSIGNDQDLFITPALQGRSYRQPIK